MPGCSWSRIQNRRLLNDNGTQSSGIGKPVLNCCTALLFIPATSTLLRTVKFGDPGDAIVPREKQATVSFSSSHSVHCSYIFWAKLHDSSTQAHFKSGVKAPLAPPTAILIDGIILGSCRIHLSRIRFTAVARSGARHPICLA